MVRSLSLFISLFVLCANAVSQHENKIIPEEVKEPVDRALHYFPELADYTIEFKFRKKLNNRVMQAQPKIKTLLRNKKKRHYKITISQELDMKDTTMYITDLSDDVLVGWFAHELGHIMDYKERSSANMIAFGLKYLTSKPFLKSSELRADALAAENGCAKHLINTKNYILLRSRFTHTYKSKIKELYPSPEDISAMLSN